MQRIDVSLGKRSYPIYIGAGALGLSDAFNAAIPSGDVLIVTNTTVGPLYASKLIAALAPR